MSSGLEDFCDYCNDWTEIRFLRPIGFDEIEGIRAPVIRFWCGVCVADDVMDPKASAAVVKAVQRD